MSHTKPFYRNYRGFVESPNAGYSQWAYIIDPEYAKAPEHYTRAFLIIIKDLKNLFEFIEPADQNLNTYSYRIHELFIRTCIEIEANFKAILRENIYTPKDKQDNPISEKKWNIHNFYIVNDTHHLASYKTMIPIWSGKENIFEPFKNWKENKDSPFWYKAFQSSKHNREEDFHQANLSNLLNAVSALLILLSSQFKTEEFSAGSIGLGIVGYDYYQMEASIGDFFRIQFPDDWDDQEKYDFNWAELKKEKIRFQKIDYNNT